MRKILITGENSYIGTSFQKWMNQYPEDYQIESISVRGDQWKEKDFSKYDVIFHIAGIAHIKETKENQNLYYQVNRDLAYEVAKKSKIEGVSQFIFLSSMSVYGIDEGVITRKTPLQPRNAYGKSKKEAEDLIKSLKNFTFTLSIVRPPMIYGKNCKGNYLSLSKFAKKSYIFPYVKNKRSMLHIDNFSYTIKYLIDNCEDGIFCPQNQEIVCTSDLVEKISIQNNKSIFLSRILGKGLYLFKKTILVKKVFGNLYYDFHDFENLPRTFEESIKLTEEI